MNSFIFFIFIIILLIVLLLSLFLLPTRNQDVIWVAVGNDDLEDITKKNVLYSKDGINWNPATMKNNSINPFWNGDGSGVAYNGVDRWVAVGEDFNFLTSSIVYSSDGIEWEPATLTTGASPFGHSGLYPRGRGVAYGNGKWVGVGHDGSSGGDSDSSSILYSTDGALWSSAAMASSGLSPFYEGRGVAYNGSDKWVAVGNDDNITSTILWSSDGESWNTACMSDGTSTFPTAGYGIAYNGSDKWVAVGDDNSGSSKILWSSDGELWNTACMSDGTSAFGSGAGSGRGVAYNGSRWVAVGEDVGTSTSNILWSSNGETWDTSSMESGGTPFGTSVNSMGSGVAYGKNKWISVGFDTATSTKNILWSFDGINWNNTNGTNFGLGGLGIAYKSLLPN